MKALEKLHRIAHTLSLAGVDGADKEAELIVREGLGSDLANIYSHNPELTREQSAALDEMVRRRRRREPLQYIVGYTEFLDLKIYVGKGVLIPRPETELMAEYAIKTAKRSAGPHASILDVCTGSGCLAIALAKALPGGHVFGTDISDTALQYAEKNAKTNSVSNITFLKGHLFDPVEPDRCFDLIISNPPYIETGAVETLQPEIKEWEPRVALDGGTDGLDYYRRITAGARQHLRDHGILMLELGDGCAGGVKKMLENEGYGRVRLHKDYAGIERIIETEWTR